MSRYEDFVGKEGVVKEGIYTPLSHRELGTNTSVFAEQPSNSRLSI
jgi:hypothetical protein